MPASAWVRRWVGQDESLSSITFVPTKIAPLLFVLFVDFVHVVVQ
jgi:hypothetical protein